MNCQDIARVLNDRNFRSISDAERRQAEVHIATCPVCAGEWEVASRLGAEEIPPLPAFLRQWHPGKAAERSAAESTARRRGRLLIVPVLLVAGAAAAVFALYSGEPAVSDSDTPAEIGAPAEPMTASAVEAVESNAAPSPDLADAAAPVDSAVAPRYRLVIMGPIQAIENVAAIQAAEGVHRGIVQFFRSRPELDVILVSQTEVAAALAELGREDGGNASRRDRALASHFDANYSIRIASRYLRDPDVWTIDVTYQYQAFGGTGAGSTGYRPVASLTDAPKSPDDAGAEMALSMYASLFPEAGMANLVSVVEDTARTPALRLDAIESLLRMGDRTFRRQNLRNALTPQAIAGAIEIGRSASDPETRRRAWTLLAQIGDPGVAQPMTDALLYDSDADVRAAVADGLLDYQTNPVVRAALETAATTDGSPDVRLRARWSTLVKEERSTFVANTLLDPRLSPEERVAPLIHARSPRYGVVRPDSIDAEIPAVDGEALNTLAAIARSSNDRDTRIAAITELGLGGHPDFVTLLRQEPEERLPQIVSNLSNRQEMPGVTERLRQVVNELEPNSPARQIIERSLAPVF